MTLCWYSLPCINIFKLGFKMFWIITPRVLTVTFDKAETWVTKVRDFSCDFLLSVTGMI